LREGSSSSGPESVLNLRDIRSTNPSEQDVSAGANPRTESSTHRTMRPTAMRDATEMTPTPMVLGAPRESRQLDLRGPPSDRLPTPSHELPITRETPVMERASGRELVRPGEPTGSDETTQPISYHPPRKPPTSIVPSRPAASFSVAPEYDPRAPTKPRVRRVSTRPPPPLLFGLDRMLVWGLVLGGLFVAVVFVLVHRLAPKLSTSHSARDGESRSVRENTSNGSPREQTVPSTASAVIEPSTLPKAVATEQQRVTPEKTLRNPPVPKGGRRRVDAVPKQPTGSNGTEKTPWIE
jgi:hypothetical protein